MTGAGSPDAGRLWSALVDVYQPVLRDVVAELERDARIDSGTYSALAYLDRTSGRMRIGELHALMRVRYSQPGLSRLVQRMEAEGLLDRTVDPADRRSTVLQLTRAGRTRFRIAHVVYEAALEKHLGSFVSATEARSLIGALTRVAAARGA
ncbi:MAG: MarR family winged helix-turn-helix transcriptional regulator [Acidimicrobiia bacterium]